MFHPIIFQIHILYTSFFHGHYQIDYPEKFGGKFKRALLTPTIMEKVALPGGYFPAALVNITSGFL